MNLPRQVLAVLSKELVAELQQRSRVSGIFFFSVALLLMLAFAAPSTQHLRAQAGGALWIGLLLSSTRSLDQSFNVEMENGALEGLVLWPVEPAAIYLGKALANALVLVLVGLATLPFLIALFDVSPKTGWADLLTVLTVGGFALAAPGTMLGLITVQARGSSVLLPLLLFPLVVPVIMAATRATSLVLEGDPMGQGDSWLSLLLAFNVIHWSLSSVLFGRIVEDA